MIFPDFDARISKIEIKPRNIESKVIFAVRQYDEHHGKISKQPMSPRASAV